jgi:class 3 adenylate cyclase
MGIVTVVALKCFGSLICMFSRDNDRHDRNYYVWEVRRKQERKLCAALISNMLPPTVVAQLQSNSRTTCKDGSTPLAWNLPHTCIFQSDIVGFTTLTQRVNPIQLMSTLHELFSAIDRLCDKHCVQKIETIGDAYIAATGCTAFVPSARARQSRDSVVSYHPRSSAVAFFPRISHQTTQDGSVDEYGRACRLARMALDVQGLMLGYRAPDGGLLSMRIGLHTGATVGGIVGQKMVRYHLFGAPLAGVNCVEQVCDIGGVRCSEEFANQLLLTAPPNEFLLENADKTEMETGLMCNTYKVHRLNHVHSYGNRSFDIFNCNFDAFLVPKADLIALVIEIFHNLGLVHEFGFSVDALMAFVNQVCELYNDDLHFHNFHHAFTVFAVCADMIQVVHAQAEAQLTRGVPTSVPPLTAIHVLAIMLAALCHDIDHPGISNECLRDTKYSSSTSLSPVEEHHVKQTKRLLCSTLGLWDVMNDADATYIQNLVTCAIMSTDLQTHQMLSQDLEQLAESLNSGENIPAEYFYDVITRAIVHAADLSNPVLDFSVCCAWSLRLGLEYKTQADREYVWNMRHQEGERVVTQVPSLRAVNITNIAQGEIYFVKAIAIPFWCTLGSVYPVLRQHVDTAKQTLLRYQNM